MVSENQVDTSPAEPTGPQYWRSLDELAQTPDFQEFVEREFPAGASEIEGVNRRGFLKLMAASFAMAGLGMAGCRRPEKLITPYAEQPENLVPGNPIYYASSMPHPVDSIPVVVKTHQARPIKIEGNAKFANYRGATDNFAQASLLDLYDPDRATRSVSTAEGNRVLTRAEVYDRIGGMRTLAQGRNGRGLAILAEGTTSPVREELEAELREQFPEMLWVEHEPAFPRHAETAAQNVVGRPLRPVYQLAQAKRVLGVDADFLHKGPGALQYARDFAQARRVHSADEASKMNRLYQAESRYTVTGGMADHRLRLQASHMKAFLARLLAELMERSDEGAMASELRNFAGTSGIDEAWVRECAIDLLSHHGESVVIVSDDQPPIVHQMAFEANRLLGAPGNTVTYLELPRRERASMAELASALEAGEIESLLVLGGNPVYQAPGDLNVRSLLEKAERSLRFGYYFDETSQACQAHVHANHYLESWDLARTLDGTVVPVQPMILPLFDGFQANELLAVLAGYEEAEPYSLAFNSFARMKSGAAEVEKAFHRWLHEGLDEGSGYPVYERPIEGAEALRASLRSNPGVGAAASKDAVEVRIVPSDSLLDGRYANNGWLQEVPDPMTKLTWDNVILISAKLAKDLGFDPRRNAWLPISSRPMNSVQGSQQWAPLAEIKVGERIVTGPVHILPGMPNYTVVCTLGYGRTKSGKIGTGTGYNAYPLTSVAHGAWQEGAAIRLTGETYELANTQDHWSMEGRAIIREANLETYQKDPDFVNHMGVESHAPANYREHQNKSLQEKVAHQYRGESLYETPRFDSNLKNWPKDTEPGGPHQWGMTIDLNTCIGCNACVIACQSENNIPIVGKDQVMRGREMHWIRMDRYFASGDLEGSLDEVPEEAQSVTMPMLCQHCEMAPCEQVCPVNATVHDQQGLNVMAYNRCVGTRYCANNCPYKVRRFNFFDWSKRSMDNFYSGFLGENLYETQDLLQMRTNPDVTVRARGVMEKCTFCVQRIQDASIRQKVKAADSADVRIPDGVVKVACQQACPAGAIEFGNLLDENSEVSHWKRSDRDYAVLGYLNTRPRTTYLARLRNPNPQMPDYFDMPLTKQEYKSKSKSGGHDKHGSDHGHESYENGHGEGSNGHAAEEPHTTEA